jgi:alpha-D-ribose 1-methylphosphonate 5-triphosphate synthase subunit PhnL
MYPSTFSGGEKQRLNILLALVTKPRLLLLDEPTASLDIRSKEIILDLILGAKKKETTMIGVFHDQEAIKVLADSRYDLLENRLIEVSPVRKSLA